MIRNKTNRKEVKDWESFKAQFRARGKDIDPRILNPETREEWLQEMGIPYSKDQIESYKKNYEMDKWGRVVKKKEPNA